MLKKTKLLGLNVVVITILGLTGCGGGSDNTPASTKNTGITYNIKDIWTKNYSFNASMTSSNKDNLAYLISQTVKSKTIINGITVTPVDSIGSIDNKTTGSSIAINVTSYYNKDGIELQNIDNTNGTICTLTNIPTPMPTNAKIGDSGTDSTLKCTDGTKSTGNWLLVTKNKQAALKSVYNIYNSNNTIERTETGYSYITTQGITTSLEGSIYYPIDDITFIIHKTAVHLR